jgi:arylsulfatase
LTDFIIEGVKESEQDGKPFFAYLAYQAPHGPLAIPEAWKDKYRGQYDKGYDLIRQERLKRQKKLGIVGEGVETFPRLPHLPAWNALTDEQRKLAARKMEVYAAMVEYMDDQIGRLISRLKDAGHLDDTLIVFLSDNGAAGEDMSDLIAKLSPAAQGWFSKTFDNRLENIGRPGSCVEYGPAWAQVSSVPLRLCKGIEADGGIRAPLIVSGPGVKLAGDINASVLHVVDILPTFLESAGVKHPSEEAGSKVARLKGKSMWPLLAGQEESTRTDAEWIGGELFGNRMIRQGDWKLLYLLPSVGGKGDWELFNLKHDPAEMSDLSAEEPEKRAAMIRLWDEYVTENGVILSNAGPFEKVEP